MGLKNDDKTLMSNQQARVQIPAAPDFMIRWLYFLSAALTREHMNIEKFILKHDLRYSFLEDIGVFKPYRFFFSLRTRSGYRAVADASKSKREIVRFLGFRMDLDLNSYHDFHFYDLYHKNSLYEAGTTKLILRVLKKRDLFVDAGANNGYYSLLAATLIGREGEAFAFEPSPRNFKRLSENVRLNGFKNITAYQIALGSKKGQAKMDVSGFEDGLDRLTPDSVAGDDITVKLDSLDNVLKGKRIALIKIDVEGYETEVIGGAKHMLADKKIKVIIEYNHRISRNQKGGFDGTINLMNELGFKIREIMPDGRPGAEDITKHSQLSSAIVNLYCYKGRIE